MKNSIGESELVLNEDGSVYHLHLRPEHIAKNIILVGDQNRVPHVSKHFDQIEFQTAKREFVTHTGFIGKKRLTVLSTGIGTDNIDIVLNELDALVNIDLETRCIKDSLHSLNIVRVGTSGTLQEDVPVDSILLSKFGLGLDGLMHYYEHKNSVEEDSILKQIISHTHFPYLPSIAKCSDSLFSHFYDKKNTYYGITLTANGFYGPQGRKLRLQPKLPKMIDDLANVRFNENIQITNLEMETSAIYGLGKLMGHQCLSINAILANRQQKTFSHEPKKAVEKTIVYALEKLLSL